MAAILITNGTLILPDRLIANGALTTDAGRISWVGPMQDLPSTRCDQMIDAKGGHISPGFIDLHVHGGRGSDFMDATPEDVDAICRYHAAGGTTTLLATTASATTEQLVAAIDCLTDAARRAPVGARVGGIHVEGPYFSFAKRGCHLESQIRDPDPAEYAVLLDRSDAIASMTLAPERPGAERLIRLLRERGAVASAGHSEATYAQVRQAVSWGLSHVTHLYCAMSTILRTGPHRQGGLLEAALACDALTTEVIADGKHLPSELISIALKCKGPERLCAVTDAMRGAGMPDGEYAFGPKDGVTAIVKDGEARMQDNSGFASSVVRMIDQIRFLVRGVGLSIESAVRMASRNPASVLAVNDRKGAIRKGSEADITVFDATFAVRHTIVGGVCVYGRDGISRPTPPR